VSLIRPNSVRTLREIGSNIDVKIRGGGKRSGFGTAYTCLSGVRPSVCLSVPAWVAAAKFAHNVRLAIGGGAYWAGRAAAGPLFGSCGQPLSLARPLFWVM